MSDLVSDTVGVRRPLWSVKTRIGIKFFEGSRQELSTLRNIRGFFQIGAGGGRSVQVVGRGALTSHAASRTVDTGWRSGLGACVALTSHSDSVAFFSLRL